MSDGGTVGQDVPLAEESRRRANALALVTARFALDAATRAGITARMHFDALREAFQRQGYTPTEAELRDAHARLTGGGQGAAQGAPATEPPRPRILTDGE